MTMTALFVNVTSIIVYYVAWRQFDIGSLELPTKAIVFAAIYITVALAANVVHRVTDKRRRTGNDRLAGNDRLV